jgi:thiol:disulfide interchange protein
MMEASVLRESGGVLGVEGDAGSGASLGAGETDMPRGRRSKQYPATARKGLWAGVWAVLALAIAALGYVWVAGPAGVPNASVEAQTAGAAATPAGKRHIYSETADPNADIAAGLAHAKREHKRVILDFGGDWCGDCQVLDIYFHQAPNVDLLEKNFVLVHVWVGHMDTNIDLAAKYGVPINRGVPALAVLAADGKVLYSQAGGEFAAMRRMDPSSVTEFLNKWKN